MSTRYNVRAGPRSTSWRRVAAAAGSWSRQLQPWAMASQSAARPSALVEVDPIGIGAFLGGGQHTDSTAHGQAAGRSDELVAAATPAAAAGRGRSALALAKPATDLASAGGSAHYRQQKQKATKDEVRSCCEPQSPCVCRPLHMRVRPVTRLISCSGWASTPPRQSAPYRPPRAKLAGRCCFGLRADTWVPVVLGQVGRLRDRLERVVPHIHPRGGAHLLRYRDFEGRGSRAGVACVAR